MSRIARKILLILRKRRIEPFAAGAGAGGSSDYVATYHYLGF